MPTLSDNVQLSSQGQFHYSARGSQIEINTIDIQSGPRQLTGRAQFELEPCEEQQCWSIPHINLRGKNNHLTFEANGRDEEIKDAKLALHIDEWQHWLPDADGDIDLQAQWQNNSLALHVNSDNLQWRQWQLAQWRLDARADIDKIEHWPSWSWQTINTLASVTQGDKNLGDWQLSAKGSAKNHQLNIKLATADKDDFTRGTLRTGALELLGALDTETFNWNGQLQQLSLLFQNNQRWQQRQPVDLQLSEALQQWQSLCIDHANSKAALCLEPGRIEQQQGALQLALSHWSLSRELSPAAQVYEPLDSALVTQRRTQPQCRVQV